MRADRSPAPFRIVSSFPGRVRLQLANAWRMPGALQACADRLSRLEVAGHVRIAPDAGSVILHYAPERRSLAAMIDEIQTVVATILHHPPPRESRSNAVAPGRENAVGHSVYAPSQGRASRLSTTRSRSSGHSPSHDLDVEASGQLKITRAKDIPAGRMPGLKPLLLPTLAMALAAVETLPVAITAAVIASAALPLARRAGQGVRSRRLTVDELDLANVVWLALQGDFLVAGVVSWLSSLGELIRGNSVRYARTELARLIGAAERQDARQPLADQVRARQALAVLRNALLSETHIQ